MVPHTRPEPNTVTQRVHLGSLPTTAHCQLRLTANYGRAAVLDECTDAWARLCDSDQCRCATGRQRADYGPYSTRPSSPEMACWSDGTAHGTTKACEDLMPSRRAGRRQRTPERDAEGAEGPDSSNLITTPDRSRRTCVSKARARCVRSRYVRTGPARGAGRVGGHKHLPAVPQAPQHGRQRHLHLQP